jgi:hypothetical protein
MPHGFDDATMALTLSAVSPPAKISRGLSEEKYR